MLAHKQSRSDVLAIAIGCWTSAAEQDAAIDQVAVVRPACRSAVVVDTDLSLEIVGQLRTLKQANDSRAWTLEQDVSLMHQMRNDVNICDVRVQGKPGEDAAANRLKVIEKRLPGISANVRRTTNAHALQEAEDSYADFKLPDVIVQALADIDRSSSKRSTSWSLREDTLLLKKWLSDSENTSTITSQDIPESMRQGVASNSCALKILPSKMEPQSESELWNTQTIASMMRRHSRGS